VLSSQVAEEALLSVFVTRPEVLDNVNFDGEHFLVSEIWSESAIRRILDRYDANKSLSGPGFRRTLQADHQGEWRIPESGVAHSRIWSDPLISCSGRSAI